MIEISDTAHAFTMPIVKGLAERPDSFTSMVTISVTNKTNSIASDGSKYRFDVNLV